MPQGTLAESIRAGGAGIGGFFTKTGLGTPLTAGCEERVIRGERYVFQESRRADVALIRARAADELGNLVYAKTARNFNPDMATAADLVIAEVDEIVPVGALDPEAIVTPHLFVDVLVARRGRRIRRMNVQERIAARAVAHIPPGSIVNLGIGIPTFVADHLPARLGRAADRERAARRRPDPRPR